MGVPEGGSTSLFSAKRKEISAANVTIALLIEVMGGLDCIQTNTAKILQEQEKDGACSVLQPLPPLVGISRTLCERDRHLVNAAEEGVKQFVTRLTRGAIRGLEDAAWNFSVRGPVKIQFPEGPGIWERLGPLQDRKTQQPSK